MDDSDSELPDHPGGLQRQLVGGRQGVLTDQLDEVYPSFLLSMLLETSVGLVSIY